MYQIHPQYEGIIEFLTKFWLNKRHCMGCTLCAVSHTVMEMGCHAALGSMQRLLPIKTDNTF